METITRAGAPPTAPLAEGERARFFTAERFDGLECLAATFRTHRYALHAHDTYVIGAVSAGCESLTVRGRLCYARPGDFIFTNPEDVHDGAPYGEGYSYRTTYPTAALLRRIAAEVSERAAVGSPFFPEPVVHDPEGVALFAAAHRLLEAGADALAADERLFGAYAHCLVRHARIVPAAVGREPGPVARVKALLAERHGEDLTLADLAAEAGLTRHRLIRAFRRETGLTPHAYLVNCRVDAARARLRRGDSPAEVAAATGFSDQAHLTRVFKARVGVTPAAYRRAVSR
ncbi:MAG TPA: AraC family transcriptional regulator [Thermodesulfobacteriota bacterium]